MIKANSYTGGFRTLISNAVYGSTPPQMQEVSQEQVFKQMREMNGNTQNLNAFPFRGASVPPQGASGNGLVSQNHLDPTEEDRANEDLW